MNFLEKFFVSSAFVLVATLEGCSLSNNSSYESREKYLRDGEFTEIYLKSMTPCEGNPGCVRMFQRLWPNYDYYHSDNSF